MRLHLYRKKQLKNTNKSADVDRNQTNLSSEFQYRKKVLCNTHIFDESEGILQHFFCI